MADLTYDEAADDVYSVAPADFIARRNEHVAAAKKAGDKALAAQIAKLRRPSVAAWLVNLLVREQADQIAALLDLGAAMRHAQARLSADELRKLTVQRQQVVRALATQAHGLAADQGEQVSRDALHQVADTLQAALADPELAEQVRQGRLSTPLSYSGFGPAGLSVVRSAPEPAEDVDEDEDDESAAAAELQRRREQAKVAVDLAARAVVKANRSAVTAKEAMTRADRDLARAEQALAEREQALAEAQTSAARARSRMQAAQEAMEAAEQAQREVAEELAAAKSAAAELEA